MNTTNTTKTTSEQTVDGESRLRPLKTVNMADVVARKAEYPTHTTTRVKDTLPNPKYTVMLHNNRFLVVKTSENGNPHVICECFLEQVAAQICQLLTDAANANLTPENTQTGGFLK
jgi:hypothetical protein